MNETNVTASEKRTVFDTVLHNQKLLIDELSNINTRLKAFNARLRGTVPEPPQIGVEDKQVLQSGLIGDIEKGKDKLERIVNSLNEQIEKLETVA